MRTCPGCGAAAPDSAPWCTLCWQPLDAPVTAAAQGGTRGTSTPAYVPDPRFAPFVDPDDVDADDSAATAASAARAARALGPAAAWGPAPAASAVALTPALTPAPESTSPIDRPALTVATAIALGGAFQLAFWWFTRSQTTEPEALVRYSLAGTVAFYVVVFLLVLYRLRTPRKPLLWAPKGGALGAAMGLLIGASLAGALVYLMSSHYGYTRTDDYAQLLVSEGDVAHIATTLLIMSIAAPLVEELLFRGIFFESLRVRGTGTAFLLSGLAFALWHWRLNIVSIGYYAAIGSVLAALYVKRGLIASMACHAAFNGTLVLVAVSIVTGAGPHVRVGASSFDAPTGWQKITAKSSQAAVTLRGPSAATLLAVDLGAVGKSPQQLADDVNSGFPPELAAHFDMDVSTAYVTQEPIGPVVRVHLKQHGHNANLAYVFSGHRVVMVALATGGSAKASHDFETMLQTFRNGP